VITKDKAEMFRNAVTNDKLHDISLWLFENSLVYHSQSSIIHWKIFLEQILHSCIYPK
jgi:hypothetical protein